MTNLDVTKPYNGKIYIREKIECPTIVRGQETLGYFCLVEFVDHPYFYNDRGNISAVVAVEGNELETVNSRYTVINENFEELL